MSSSLQLHLVFPGFPPTPPLIHRAMNPGGCCTLQNLPICLWHPKIYEKILINVKGSFKNSTDNAQDTSG